MDVRAKPTGFAGRLAGWGLWEWVARGGVPQKSTGGLGDPPRDCLLECGCGCLQYPGEVLMLIWMGNL